MDINMDQTPEEYRRQGYRHFPPTPPSERHRAAGYMLWKSLPCDTPPASAPTIAAETAATAVPSTASTTELPASPAPSIHAVDIYTPEVIDLTTPTHHTQVLIDLTTPESNSVDTDDDVFVDNHHTAKVTKLLPGGHCQVRYTISNTCEIVKVRRVTKMSNIPRLRSHAR
jgi:hypothetical protein